MRKSLSLKKFSIFSLVLTLIIFLGFFLRLVNLGRLPAVMHRDEAAIAYNAYSILETKHDEWGEYLPIVFRSFGDYKLPGLIYSTIAGIKLFGLNPLGSRVVTAILASLAIPMMFIFTKELFKSRFIALISTILLTFSFWHISGSRNIYEPIVALSLSIPSYLALFKAVTKTKYLILGILFFSISIWFYHTPLLIYPSIFILWFIRNRAKFSKKVKKLWILAFVLIVVIAGSNFFALAKLNKSRSETTIFMSQELKDAHQTEMHKFWVAGVPLHPLFTNLERFFQLSYYFVQGYVKGISPDFIFFTGGNNYWHNLKSIGFGNVNPILLPFSILGFTYLIKNKKRPENYFLLYLLILSPIPNALTVDSPNINRLMDFHFLLLLLSAIGFYYFYTIKLPKNKTLVNVHKTTLLVAIIVYVIFVGQFLAKYFLTYNLSLHSTWNEGMPGLVEQVEANKSNYDKVIVSIPVSESYIFFLFYTKYDPQKLLNIAKNQNENLSHAQKIENIYFNSELETLDLNNKKVLLVTAVDKQPEKNSIFIIKNWEGVPIWQGYELTKNIYTQAFF